MKKSAKRILCLFITFSLVTLPFSNSVFGMTNNDLSSGKLGKIPSAIKVTKQNTNLKKSSVSLPASYDLRKLNRVTSPKDQGDTGSCWAFASSASLESYLLSKGFGTYDFSENNMVTGSTSSKEYLDGGNRDMATAYYANWSGPVLESQDPDSLDNVINRGSFSPSFHVQDVIYLPDRENSFDNSEIKSSLISYGAVDSSLCWQDEYYDMSDYSYYDYNMDKTDYNNQPNHDITIVGWDDNYSRTNFETEPQGNGAFICKNSWGTDWGDGGYFYVSYYDTSIGSDSTIFTGESNKNYDHIYEYDKYSMTGEDSFGTNEIWFANKFNATAQAQSLAAVSFYATEENTYYEVYYSLADSPFSSLIKVKSGYIDKAGYRTIKLDNPLDLVPSKKYTVAVRLKVSSGVVSEPVEVRDYYGGEKIDAAPGRSYDSPDGEYWYDINEYSSTRNFGLKAFTVDKPSILQGDYTKWKDETTSDVNKVWNIKLSNAADPSTINNNNIYIYDKLFRKVNSSVTLDPDKETIHVSVPTGTYVYGDTYTLVITSTVSTTSGKRIQKPVVMNFDIK